MKLLPILLLFLTAHSAFGQWVVADAGKLIQSTIWAVTNGLVGDTQQAQEAREEQKKKALAALEAAWGGPVAARVSKPVSLSGITAEERASRLSFIEALKNSEEPSVVALRTAYQQDDDWQKTLAIFAARLNEAESRNGKPLAFNERLALESQMGVHKNQALLLAIKAQQDDAEKLQRLRAEKAMIREEEMRREEMSAAVQRASSL
jgi:hypothetical protein